jgi:hypothetical protein
MIELAIEEKHTQDLKNQLILTKVSPTQHAANEEHQIYA